MSRRAAGTGTVEQVASGRYRFKLHAADGQRHTSPTFDTYEEAERALHLMLHGLAQGNLAPVGAITLEGYGGRWLDRRRSANIDTERSQWRHHIAGSDLAGMPIAEIRRRHVREWAEDLAGKKRLVQVLGGGRAPGTEPISPQTRRLCFQLVRTCLGAAVDEEIIQVNPAAGLRIDFGAGGAGEGTDAESWSFLDEAEVALVLVCEAIPLAARLHYQWAIGEGPRQGESWGLRWRDADMAGASVEIRRSYGGRTKGKKVRRAPLLPLALDALRQWYELAPSVHPDALVWPARLRPPATLGGRWRSEGEMRPDGDDMGWADRSRGKQGVSPGHKTQAGITRAVRYHDLRHTCASHLVMGTWGRRWTLEEVCSFLDHSSITVTERYAHLAPGHLARAAAETGGGARSHQPSPVPPAALVSPAGSPELAGREVVRPSVTAARFERATYGLGNGSTALSDQALTPQSGPSQDQRALAQQLVLEVAGGRAPSADLVRALAGAVVAPTPIQIALQILAGGEGGDLLTLAMRLATEILTSQPQEVARQAGAA